MDNNEMLQAIGQLIDEKLQPIHQEIGAMHQEIGAMHQEIGAMHQEFDTVHQEIKTLRTDVATMIEESETRTHVKIENEVTKRIDALFDGYKLTHEKQYELEHKVDRLEQQIDEIRTRLGMAG